MAHGKVFLRDIHLYYMPFAHPDLVHELTHHAHVLFDSLGLTKDWMKYFWDRKGIMDQSAGVDWNIFESKAKVPRNNPFYFEQVGETKYATWAFSEYPATRIAQIKQNVAKSPGILPNLATSLEMIGIVPGLGVGGNYRCDCEDELILKYSEDIARSAEMFHRAYATPQTNIGKKVQRSFAIEPKLTQTRLEILVGYKILDDHYLELPGRLK